MGAAIHSSFKCFILYLAFFLSASSTDAQLVHRDHSLSAKLDSAEILKHKKEYELSIELCTSVIEFAKRIGDHENEARGYSELGDIYRDQHEIDKADGMLDSAGQIVFNQLGQENLEHVRHFFYRGKTLRTKYFDGLIQNKDSALNHYKTALELVRGIEVEGHGLSVDILLELANYYRWTGENEKARSYYNQLMVEAEATLRKTEYRRGLYLYYLGTYYYGIGDYERAELLLDLARGVFLHQDSFDFNRRIIIQHQLAVLYFETMRYQKSVRQFKTSINELRAKYGPSHESLIYPYNNICQSLINIDSLEQAISYANRAVDLINVNPGYERSLYFLYNNLAEAYAKSQEYDNAETYFKKTVEFRIQRFGEHHEEVYEGYRYFAEYFHQRSLYPEALDYYQLALEALYPNFEPANVYDNPEFVGYDNPEQLLYILFGKSSALYSYFLETGEMDALYSAEELFVTGYEKMDELIDNDYLDKSSMHLFNRFGEGLDQSIECLVQLYKKTDDQNYLEIAFQFIEKNKYILLYKELIRSHAYFEQGEEKQTYAEGILSSQIDELRLKISKIDNQDSLFENRNRLLKLLIDRENVTPKVAKKLDLQRTPEFNKESLSLLQAQQLLRNPHEVIIDYHKTSDKLFSFLVGIDFVDLIEIEWSPELDQNINVLKNHLSMSYVDSRGIDEYQSSAYFIYQHILEPIEKKLSIRDSVHRIIIVPDGPLATLPFDALVTDTMKEPSGYWSLNYLCKKYSISYAYSLSILEKNLSRGLDKKNPKMLAMAYSNVSNNESDERIERDINELPYSGLEIDNISKHLKTTAFLGEDATESSFKNEAQEYAIIHLAIHGQADTANMFNSRLIFNLDKAQLDDGKLHAHELYSLNLSKLDMAVLSACETGIGKQYEGEGVFSIARGFAYAGCPAIIMSLWKVNDKATAELMDNFYKFLVEGMQKDEALRMAKLDYIANSDDFGAHPANWAAFIPLGNYQALQINDTKLLYLYFLVILGVILVIFVWERIKKKRKQNIIGD